MKIRELSLLEIRILLQVLVLLPAIGLGLRFVGWKRLLPVLQGWPKNSRRSVDHEDIMDRNRLVARIVSIAAQHGPFRATCLPSSLAAWFILRRQGIDSQIRIGVRPTDEGLAAHAWVEYAGTAIKDGDDSRHRFTTLAPIDSTFLAEPE